MPIVTQLPVGITDGTNIVAITNSALSVTSATSSSSNVTSVVASSAISVLILHSFATRIGAMIFNDSNQTLYLKFGLIASTSSYTVKIPAQGYYEFPNPVYTGQCDGIWDAPVIGNAVITEMT